MLGFDVHGADLPAVLSRVEICARPIMRVIERKPDGHGLKTIRRIPRTGMKGVPSSAAPSTSVETV